MRRHISFLLMALTVLLSSDAFAPTRFALHSRHQRSSTQCIKPSRQSIGPPHSTDSHNARHQRATVTSLRAVVQDLSVIALVAGQENYGLALVCVGEALWSFVQAPSFSHAKVLVPAGIAAVLLVAVSGPMITGSGGDAATVGTGLWIATATSVGLAVSYVARMLAPFSPSPKEAAALGLLVAVAGFFSFGQNLVVDGFVSLPTLPSLPSLPEINLDLGL